MSAKRQRTGSSSGDTGHSRAKRGKFILDESHIPSTVKHGAVFVTGAGDLGQLGLGPDVLEKQRPALVALGHEIVDVCAGGVHTVCLTKDGKVITFGCNDEGALGRPTANEDAEFTPGEVELPGKIIQISAGDSHTAVLLDDGRVFAWGTFRDSHGNMGLTASGNEKLPYLIIAEKHIMKIASGADHIVFLSDHGEIFTCGCAEQGQLGRITERSSGRFARNCSNNQLAKLLVPSPIILPARSKINFDNIWAGTYATFAKVAGKDDVYVFGLNNYNQLGLKSLKPQYIPKISSEFCNRKWDLICSAQHHTIALDKDGKCYALGRKEYGRLGLGENCEDAATLVEIPALVGKTVTDIGCGSATSFAVTDEGELYGWGMGSVGQLGTGNEDDLFEPTIIKSKQLADRKVHRVSSGGQHTVILAVIDNNNSSDKKQ